MQFGCKAYFQIFFMDLAEDWQADSCFLGSGNLFCALEWHLLILELKEKSFSQSLIRKEKIKQYFLLKCLGVCRIHETLCWFPVFLAHLLLHLVLWLWKRNDIFVFFLDFPLKISAMLLSLVIIGGRCCLWYLLHSTLNNIVSLFSLVNWHMYFFVYYMRFCHLRIFSSKFIS